MIAGVAPPKAIENGLVVLAVVVLNTLIGFVQEYRAGRAIEALSAHGAGERHGAARRAAAARCRSPSWCPGDVVVLASGDKVPADLRLLAVAQPADRGGGADRRVGAGEKR